MSYSYSTNKLPNLSGLPAMENIKNRLAKIKQRQEARKKVAAFIRGGNWDEALRIAQDNQLNLVDDPISLREFRAKLMGEKEAVEKELAAIGNSLNQAKHNLDETKKVLQEQEVLAACFRGDEALERLDISALATVVGYLTKFEQRDTSPSSWMKHRLSMLRTDLAWLQSEERSNLNQAQSSPQKWIEFVAKCSVENSRLAILRRQKLQLRLLDSNIDSGYINKFEELKKHFRNGEINNFQKGLDALDHKLTQESHSFSDIECLSYQNRVAIFRQYRSMYMKAQESLTQAGDDLKEARQFRGKSQQARGLYADRVRQSLKRLKRDLLALPPEVKGSYIKQSGAKVTLQDAYDKKVLEMQGFRWEKNRE